VNHCPACGKAVDPLRAGHVAFLDDSFVYFCSAQHKSEFLAKGAIARNDVETAEPPKVAARKSIPRIDEESEPPPPPAPPAPVVEPITTPEPEPVPPPSSLPAIRVAPPPKELPEPQDTNALSFVGAVAGVLAAAVRLVGPSLEAIELPLALVAVAAFGALVLRSRTKLVRVPQLVGVAVAGGIAVWARVTGDSRTPPLTSLAGVAAACALAADVVAARAEAAIDRARRHIADRLDLRARVVASGAGSTVEDIPGEEVRAGQQVVVEIGEVSAVDGFVAAGEAVVLPWAEAPADVNKKEGDAIVAGAQVVTGTLRIRATRSGPDRAWLKLTASPEGRVEVASPLPRQARRIVILGGPAAAVAACIASAFGGVAPIEALATGAAVLVSLGAPGPALAVAVRHARGQLAALAHGIVYRDAVAFDRAGQVDVAVACARGTLLLGEPEVVAIEAFAGANVDATRIVELAAGAMNGSSHPFAQAISRTARARGARPENVRNAVHAGSGATALVASSEKLVVGRRAFLRSENVGFTLLEARATELEAQGRSVLLVGLAGKVIGLLALQDGLRAGARAAVQRLHDARIEPVLMSGEARETCDTIGRALDIEHVRPEVVPSDRGSEVKALGGAHVVAVFGHPSRDDGALGAADVSVALGAAGAAPGEWAVVLASEDVRDAALALTIPQQVRERSRVALAWGLVLPTVGALAVVLIGLPWLVAPLAAFVGSTAALLYAKE
jgi:P-type E1-E2 ATPase